MPGSTSPDVVNLIARAKRLVTEADKWRDSAEKVLYWASCSLKTPGVSPYNDTALELVHRCFKVKDHVLDIQKQSNITKIKKCFRAIADFFVEVKADKGFLTVGTSSNPADIAFAIVGGWKSGDKDGLTFVLDKCKNKSDADLTDIIMHESAHFAGGIDHASVNGKPAYGSLVFGLSSADALNNASSYAYLAYLARMDHTKWLTAT